MVNETVPRGWPELTRRACDLRNEAKSETKQAVLTRDGNQAVLPRQIHRTSF